MRGKGFGGRSIDYTHYLPELGRKPQALRQVASELVQALGPAYVRAWRHLVDKHGPKQAARGFAQVVQAVEQHGVEAIAPRVELALAQGEPLQLALRTTAAKAEMSAEALPPSWVWNRAVQACNFTPRQLRRRVCDRCFR